MFNVKYRHSKYLTPQQLKQLFNSVYKEKVLGELKCTIQYHFERDFFDNETMFIYSDRPNLLLGKTNEHINKLISLYKQVNPKCKDIQIYETNYFAIN